MKERGVVNVTVQPRGKRRLAYLIGKFQDGIYVQMNFEADGSQIAPLERLMRLSEETIRFLTLKLEEGVTPTPTSVEMEKDTSNDINQFVDHLLAAVEQAETDKLSELVRITKLDIAEDLVGIDLSGEDLSYDDLSGFNLTRANLSGTILRETKLCDANLSEANLSNADLTEADLSGADLSSVNLSEANLSRADLSKASFNGTVVKSTRFGDNEGISDEQREDLIARGAIFTDVSVFGDRLLLSTMSDVFSPAEVERLSKEIDAQLQELQGVAAPTGLKSPERDGSRSAVKQREAIASLTGEPPESFLRKLARVTHKDLCEEGGLLKQQWEKYRDVANKDLIKVVVAGLTAIGVTEGLALLVVPVSVMILHLGVRTICEEYGDCEEYSDES